MSVTRAIIPLITLPLSACIYVPPVWDLGKPIRHVDSIKVCQSTRSDVLAALGKPTRGGGDEQTASALWYSGSDSDGLAVGLSPGLGAGGLGYGSVNEESWYINVTFDEGGIVQSISYGTGGAPTNKSCPMGKSAVLQP